LDYHLDHVYRLLKAGIIQGQRFRQAWVIDCEEVERIKALQGKGGRLPKAPKQSNL
jgi:hypothetical protein